MARIVVIEDDPDVGRLLAAVLGDEGHVVDLATDGGRGLMLVAQVRPDLVIVDIGLPGAMDGLEVTRQLRAGAPDPEVPVLALTAKQRPEDRAKAIEAGVTEYLVKPYDIVDLVARVSELAG